MRRGDCYRTLEDCAELALRLRQSGQDGTGPETHQLPQLEHAADEVEAAVGDDVEATGGTRRPDSEHRDATDTGARSRAFASG